MANGLFINADDVAKELGISKIPGIQGYQGYEYGAG